MPMRNMPTAADLAEYAGDYYSPDAETTLTAGIEDDKLVLRRRPDARIPLTVVSFYRGGGSAHIYCVALGHALRCNVEHGCGALVACLASMPVCTASHKTGTENKLKSSK